MKERVQASKSMARCPYCHDDLKVEKDIVACAPCGARHHRDCHAEHGRCASCGAEEALYPRDFAERRADDPPRGSRIRVSRREGLTEYRWEVGKAWDFPIIVMLCLIFPPLGLYHLYRRFQLKELALEIGPDGLDMPAIKWGGFAIERVRIPRSAIARVRVVMTNNTSLLSVDSGIQRHFLATSYLLPSVTPPELEWLAEQIDAWRKEA